ncbi:hypothetical protein [Vacuolonema iberomarrocanum]|uniref:hypothetical protein n=1 Tax=Vacuolonema iberomarrocanum TaxID=3454632 RepID=UPI0019F3637B|nr:hypothetical protein [filamentous cyanobacterium LEGE 07170]
MKWCLSAAVVVGLLAIAPQADAQTQVEIGGEDPIQETLEDGNIRVEVNYEPGEDGSWFGEVNYEIFYDGASWAEGSREFGIVGAIALQDLDSDGNAEVIVETFSGGAHCCTTHEIYSWVGDGFAVAETGMRDGSGGVFEDLNGDGAAEFIGYDNRFLYTFSSYAGSFPPSQIYTFQNGDLVETTRQFPEHLRSQAWDMYQAIQRIEGGDYEINGVLAGYVAQKILLGEYEEGWDLMLARYDRNSDWGLNIYNDEGEVAGSHSDFPNALRAFLIDNGYLSSNGDPL